ncbi:hypothetical protein [Alicyclobacillus macrosporangiidus]|jgi:hypothetical protein|uniref:Uncharacterized protein n=1 Tax=Alicyclobacillus macrosporangiidus TaxID=392015 RepID=A0A1I7FXH7_9BACL|nr:hypothetical protein [Alicyclobacillus macrosporangiidus]SFU40870.1 hypothetical protein SAMN05421543_101502 [Alicyclobacillus macrosporangiidus]
MAGAKTALVKALHEVAVKLYDYCSIECEKPWACDECPIFKAKRTLEHVECGVHIPELLATLEPDEIDAIEKPIRHFVVIKGGRS